MGLSVPDWTIRAHLHGHKLQKPAHPIPLVEGNCFITQLTSKFSSENQIPDTEVLDFALPL